MRCFLISLVIHCVCFILLDAGTGGGAVTAVASPVGQVAPVQVHLVPRGDTVVADPGASTVTSFERWIATRTIDKLQGGVLRHVQNDAAPELVSEVSTEIDDYRVTGFMILALEINDLGVPGKVEVIYSDLPAETAEMLAKRFAVARFKPAVKGGQVTAASILMRIDVE